MNFTPPDRRRRFAALAAAACAAIAALAPASASAGLLVESATDCEAQSLSKPFLPWVDVADYTPVPGGDMEAGAAGWSLAGGAAVVSGNEPWRVSGAGDSRSLNVPAGASVTTPAMCVGLEHPTIRFFSKSGQSSLQGGLRVEVLVEDTLGVVRAVPVARAGASGSWNPGLAYAVVANLLPLLPGEHTAVAFRFTAEGTAFRVDDVYVDPYARG